MENFHDGRARATGFIRPDVNLFQKLSMDPLAAPDRGAAVGRRSGSEQRHDSLGWRCVTPSGLKSSRKFRPDVAAQGGVHFFEKQNRHLIADGGSIAASQIRYQMCGDLGGLFRSQRAGVGIDGHNGGIRHAVLGFVQQHNCAGAARCRAIGCAGEVIGNDHDLWRHALAVLTKRIR
jgi:hypothetical protein